MNWLRVLGTPELSQIDQGVRQQFHANMSLLQVFKPEQQPLEFVLPRKGSIHTSSQGIDDFIEQTLSPALRVLSIARILCDVGEHAGIENTFAIVRGIQARVKIELRTC